eukprot:1808583-Rhodomonas_salina.1
MHRSACLVPNVRGFCRLAIDFAVCLQAGFPSDHIPIGALLTGEEREDDDEVDTDDMDDEEAVENEENEGRRPAGGGEKSGVSLNVRRRNAAYTSARATRSRHN